jgi:hypothetical protein
VQPVLGWWGGGWTIASWNCCKDGNVTHSDPVSVSTGDVLYGYASGTNCGADGDCSDWEIYTGDKTTGKSTTLNSSSFGQIFDWSFGAVLEAYGIDHCAQYPADGKATFSNIAVRKVNGSSASIAWPSGTADTSPSCSYAYRASGATVTLTTTPTIQTFPNAPTHCGVLNADEGLAVGQTLTSCDGRFTLTMQSDGNLVLYQGPSALWATNTAGSSGYAAFLQGDGNFVLYDAGGKPIFASGTNGHSGSRLELQNDGNLVVYDPANRPLWGSGTCCH